ncbi:hypothetical protein [Rodentibacter pneumotropicus]|uniref:Uncharacterized protein n=1 Tax=Rodentibacter pneumotropicus TaxID=758 RepID=A0A4S2Q863_9PAST|nr:hypothetical protein [Rodentibacter pneumotropicus]THA12325.1 hypothetical protein D3M76_10085 [Rodentibacter pneumotropicus]
MASKPIYQEKLNQLGCCGSGSVGGKLSEQLAELQKKIEKQSEQIKELQNALSEKIDKSSLITVHSLEDEALFKAFPLDNE